MVGSNSRYVAERSGKEEEREGADRKGGGKGKVMGSRENKRRERKGEERARREGRERKGGKDGK